MHTNPVESSMATVVDYSMASQCNSVVAMPSGAGMNRPNQDSAESTLTLSEAGQRRASVISDNQTSISVDQPPPPTPQRDDYVDSSEPSQRCNQCVIDDAKNIGQDSNADSLLKRCIHATRNLSLQSSSDAESVQSLVISSPPKPHSSYTKIRRNPIFKSFDAQRDLSTESGTNQ